MAAKPKKKELAAVAKELNALLKPEPRIDGEAKAAELVGTITTAAGLLAKGDVISKETAAFFKTYSIEHKATTKEPAKKKAAAKAKAAPAKKTAAKKGPGVIATIFEMLKGSKRAMTEDQIVAKLKKAFPDREEKSMRSTVKVQLPGRMSREKSVKIERTDKGFVMK
jgi:hypothetical protein